MVSRQVCVEILLFDNLASVLTRPHSMIYKGRRYVETISPSHAGAMRIINIARDYVCEWYILNMYIYLDGELRTRNHIIVLSD